MYKIAPLPGTFMLTSILGFILSSLYVKDILSLSWAFAFSLVFVMMFIASFISMTKADVDAELALDEYAFYRKKKNQ